MDILIDLKEFITDKFDMHNKVLEQKFKLIETQIDGQNTALDSLKESVTTLQTFISEIETPREAALARDNFKMELEVYKSQIEAACAIKHTKDKKDSNPIGQLIMKYPKAIAVGVLSIIVLLLTGDVTKLFHLLGF